MHGILLLPVAGLLFLGLAGVEWALYRLEQNEVHHSRLKAFGASSLGLLLLWGGISYWPGRPEPGTWVDPTSAPASMKPEAGAPTAAASTLLQPALPALDLVVAILHRTEPPTLHQARAERDQLLNTRRTLAALPVGSEADDYLLQQVDTVIGTAYASLGEQWRLVRAGEWNLQTQATALTTVRYEWSKWEKLQPCVTTTTKDCIPQSDRSERAAALHVWQRALRLYLLDCIRFTEDDPELAWLPAAELQAARNRLALARTELVAHPLPTWGTAITAAADHLFVAAEHALQVENASSVQGHWDRQTMARAYRPVQEALDLLFQRSFCALGGDLPCFASGQ